MCWYLVFTNGDYRKIQIIRVPLLTPISLQDEYSIQDPLLICCLRFIIDSDPEDLTTTLTRTMNT